jgi:hypothetical protein
MRKRIAKVGDPTSGMWRRKSSLLPRFEQLGIQPGDPTIVELRRRRRRWPERPRPGPDP